MFGGDSLCFDEMIIATLFVKQLIVFALFDNTAILHNDDVVYILDGREPVCDDNCCSALSRLVKSRLDNSFTLCV